MGRIFQFVAILVVVVILAAVWRQPLEIDRQYSQDFSGEVVARNLPNDFSLEFTGVIWLRLFSNEPFTVNGEQAQSSEYGDGYLYEPAYRSMYDLETHVLSVNGSAAVSLQATGNVSLSVTTVEKEASQVLQFLATIFLALLLVMIVGSDDHSQPTTPYPIHPQPQPQE